MVSSCDVIFVKVYIIWLRTAQKNVLYSTLKKSFFFIQISTIVNRSKTQFQEKNGTICYITSLSFDEKIKIRRHKGTNIYRFGDGNLFTAIENVNKPIVLGKQHVMLNTDIIASDILLKSTKKADMTLDFKNDNAMVFGETVKLITTKSGHYTIPISPYKTVLNKITTGINTNITLITTQTNKSKLHRPCAHPRMVKLMNSAGNHPFPT